MDTLDSSKHQEHMKGGKLSELLAHDSKTEDTDNNDMSDITWSVKFRHFFSEDWSVAGMKYVLMSGAAWFRRSAWLILVLFGFGFMIFQFSERIRYFISNPTSVSIKVNHKKSIDFPVVTICNENIIKADVAATIPGLQTMIEEIYPPIQNPAITLNFTHYTEIMTNISSMGLQWDNLWHQMSPSYQKSGIVSCFYNGQSCAKDDFEVVATTMGFCLQFNGGNSSRKSTYPGSTAGLWMILNADQNNYLFTRSRGTGFRVLLHPKNEVPYVFELGFKVMTGMITSAAFRLKTVKDLPSPYGNCSDTAGYLFQNCYDDCFNEFVLQRCGCRFPTYKPFTDNRACDLLQKYDCADSSASYFDSSTCSCPQACLNEYYQLTLSSMRASEFAKNAIAPVECARTYTPLGYDCTNTTILANVRSTVDRDFAELEVYYDKLTLEEVKTESAYGLLALLCDIGGALGLILGSTILTFFEVLDFGIITIYDYVRMRTNKPKKHAIIPMNKDNLTIK